MKTGKIVATPVKRNGFDLAFLSRDYFHTYVTSQELIDIGKDQIVVPFGWIDLEVFLIVFHQMVGKNGLII
ncbi:hypothetical protein [Spirosoma rhododendri]|uniref:Uncharacterized protein n=1 Tax=Spirosoma rhododendri TaxID=2728024 RepID=A0A7L5DRC3_9BACT|nr:hypothetical protein [Spirosoma rhododendri]QJD80989.1 hypothetical protein HH216_23120 [Spirosoma rhododendri]